LSDSNELVFKGSLIEYLEDNPKTPDRGRTARELYYGVIEDAINDTFYRNDVYKEVLRSLLSQLNLYYVDSRSESSKIKIHHGRQDRAVAKMFQENNIILPYASIFQFNVSNDGFKRKTGSIILEKKVWNDEARKAERVISIADVPVKVTYQLGIWTRYISDMDQISALVRNKFNPDLKLKTPFSDNLVAFLSEETDTSVVEVSDKEDRLIRKTFLIDTEFYIPSPQFKVTSTGRIEKFIIDATLPTNVPVKTITPMQDRE
jgi:hypothetical protein